MTPRVMVPLDGSDFAEFALPLAASVAEKSGAELEMVMVQEIGPVLAMEGWDAAFPEAARAYMSGVAERLGGGGDGAPSTAVLAGRPSVELERHAVEQEVDLVVMATHGRGAMSRMWLGSVADELVRHSPAPVLLVRPERDEKADLAARPSLGHILVPLDGSETAEAVLGPARRLGDLFGSRYSLLRVVRYPDELISAYVPGTIQMSQRMVDEGMEYAREYLGGMAERLRGEGLEVETHVVVDSRPGSAILACAEDHGADLVAMATHGRGGLTRTVLGSVADKVVRGSHRPVLVFRPE